MLQTKTSDSSCMMPSREGRGSRESVVAKVAVVITQCVFRSSIFYLTGLLTRARRFTIVAYLVRVAEVVA